MKNLFLIGSALALLLMMGSCGETQTKTEEWEYKVLQVAGKTYGPTDNCSFGEVDLQSNQYVHVEDQEISELGEEGWELVSVVPIVETKLPHVFDNHTSPDDIKSVVRTSALRFYFKRRK